jgi:NIPSNAP
MFYEYRRYTAAPSQANALNARFEHHAVRAMREHGYRILGFWNTDVGALGTLNYLLGWDSLDQRSESNRSLWSDRTWTEAYYSTPPLTSHRSSEIWRRAPYSPGLQTSWPDGGSDQF